MLYCCNLETFQERISCDDACHLKKCCCSCTEGGGSSVQEAGEDRYGSRQVIFQESGGLMVQSQLRPLWLKWTAWSKCLCVCCHLYTDIQLTFCFVLFLLFFVVVYIYFFFLLEEEGGSEHKIVKETGQISIGGVCSGRTLRTELQCISWKHLKQNGHLKFPNLKKDKV